MRRRWITLALMSLIAVLASSQMTPKTLRFSNVASCPLVAQVRPSGDKLLITNRSGAPVVAYRWGCVSEEGGHFKLVKTLRREAQRFGAVKGDAVVDGWGDFLSAYQYDAQICSRSSATLAIIRVWFEDGGEWALQEHGSPAENQKADTSLLQLEYFVVRQEEFMTDNTNPQQLQLTLSDLLDGHLNALRIKGYSEFTIRNRYVHIRLFIWCGLVGITGLEEITLPVLERYQQYLFDYRVKNGQPLTAASRHARLVPLRVWFRWMARRRLILEHPAGELGTAQDGTGIAEECPVGPRG